jgi:hypothetical protein
MDVKQTLLAYLQAQRDTVPWQDHLTHIRRIVDGT